MQTEMQGNTASKITDVNTDYSPVRGRTPTKPPALFKVPPMSLGEFRQALLERTRPLLEQPDTYATEVKNELAAMCSDPNSAERQVIGQALLLATKCTEVNRACRALARAHELSGSTYVRDFSDKLKRAAGLAAINISIHQVVEYQSRPPGLRSVLNQMSVTVTDDELNGLEYSMRCQAAQRLNELVERARGDRAKDSAAKQPRIMEEWEGLLSLALGEQEGSAKELLQQFRESCKKKSCVDAAMRCHQAACAGKYKQCLELKEEIRHQNLTDEASQWLENIPRWAGQEFVKNTLQKVANMAAKEGVLCTCAIFVVAEEEQLTLDEDEIKALEDYGRWAAHQVLEELREKVERTQFGLKQNTFSGYRNRAMIDLFRGSPDPAQVCQALTLIADKFKLEGVKKELEPLASNLDFWRGEAMELNPRASWERYYIPYE